MALNVATTSGKVIQIQMAFAHLVAAKQNIPLLYLNDFILHHQTLFFHMIYEHSWNLFHFLLAKLVALHFTPFVGHPVGWQSFEIK